MKTLNRSQLLIVMGVLCLLLGCAFTFFNSPTADPAAISNCRTVYADQPGVLPKCDDAAFASAVAAPDAASAGRAIGMINQQQVGLSTLSYFLFGIGAALLLGGILQPVSRRKDFSTNPENKI